MKYLLVALTLIAPTVVAFAAPPAEFKLKDVITFPEPTMSCPNVDGAVETYKHDAEWLTAHQCKNLVPT